MDQFGQNFNGLLGWCSLTIGWVVPVPCPHQLGLGLHTVLFPFSLLLLLGQDTPFQKAFDEANQNVIADF